MYLLQVFVTCPANKMAPNIVTLLLYGYFIVTSISQFLDSQKNEFIYTGLQRL